MMPAKRQNGLGLYAVLGVSSKATAAEIRRAYLKLAKTAHPDAGGSSEAFATIKFAYDVLSSPEARARYDATGEAKLEPSVDNVKAMLYEMIINAIEVILAHLEKDKIDPINVDFSVCLEEWFDNSISNSEKKQNQLNKRRKLYKRLQNRFKHKKSDENVIEMLLDGRIKNLIQQISHINDQIEKFKMAKELCSEYSYKFEMVVRKADWVTFNFTGTSST